MAGITIPVIVYCLEDAREEMSVLADHEYNIGTVRKAVREKRMDSIRVDDRTVVVTADSIQKYLRKYARKFRKSRTSRGSDLV